MVHTILRTLTVLFLLASVVNLVRAAYYMRKTNRALDRIGSGPRVH